MRRKRVQPTVGGNLTQHIVYIIYLVASALTAAISTAGRDGELFACMIFNGVLLVYLLVYHIKVKRVSASIYRWYFISSIAISIVISLAAMSHLEGMGGMMVVIAPFFNIVPVLVNTILLAMTRKFSAQEAS